MLFLSNFIPPAQIQTAMYIMNFVITIGAFVTCIITIMKTAAKPMDTWKSKLEERMARVEERQEKYEERLLSAEKHIDNDNKRLLELEKANDIVLHSLLHIMSYLIDSNDKEALKDARDDLQDYLVNRKSNFII